MIENTFYYDYKKEKILKLKNNLKDNRMFTENEILKLFDLYETY